MCFFSESSRLVPAHDDMCLMVSDSLRGKSLHAMLKYEGPASIVKLFFTLSSCPCILHIFDHIFGIRLGRARNVLHLGALSVSSRIGGERIIRTSLTLIRCVFFFVHLRVYFQAIAPFGQSLIVIVFVIELLCHAGYVH